MRRVTVKEALAILGSGFAGTVPARAPLPDRGAPAGEKEKNSYSLEVVNVRAVEHPALLQYLEGRCISTGGCAPLAQRNALSTGRRTQAVLRTRIPCGGGFDARSPVFKGFVGKDKDISSIRFADKGTVAVFEGAYDFLSWLAMRELVEPDCAVIILHSVSLKRRALDAINEHGFGRVLLYLDHDQAGREATKAFQRELGNRNVVDRSSTYHGFKDLNEWRVAIGHRTILG